MKELTPREQRHRIVTLLSQLRKDLRPGQVLNSNYGIKKYKKAGIINSLLNRFVTSQKVKEVCNKLKLEQSSTLRVEEYQLITNIIEFKVLGLDLTIKYNFSTEKKYRTLQSRVNVEREKTYYIKNSQVTKEEYEAYQSSK